LVLVPLLEAQVHCSAADHTLLLLLLLLLAAVAQQFTAAVVN
jgi:hypothetical protein